MNTTGDAGFEKPLAFRAWTLTWYTWPLARAPIRHDSAVLTHVRAGSPALVAVTVNDTIGEPPSETGGSHAIVAEPGTTTACGDVGDAGVDGVRTGLIAVANE